MYLKERKKCRTVVNLLVQRGISLEEIADNPMNYSYGLRMQSRKMLSERAGREWK